MSGQSYLTFDDAVLPAGQCFRIQTPSNSVETLSPSLNTTPLRVRRFVFQGAMQAVEGRRIKSRVLALAEQGMGWENIVRQFAADGQDVSHLKWLIRRVVLEARRPRQGQPPRPLGA